MESNANPMFKHINATLEEKVEILATNPFRYYLAPNLWIGRNESRIDELNSILKEAEENENFELCARIKEVTKKLRTIFLKNVLVEIVHSDMIKICFTTLVIRIDRINKKYGDLSMNTIHFVKGEHELVLNKVCAVCSAFEFIIELLNKVVLKIFKLFFMKLVFSI